MTGWSGFRISYLFFVSFGSFCLNLELTKFKPPLPSLIGLLR
uniref:Uncharacterized protein n=1 Tax=Arundo donax TaxID=35708 RepID=A0A0A9H2W9_ARUDO